MSEWIEVLLGTVADRTAKVVVTGQGYVGRPVAMRAVKVGSPVVGCEMSAKRTDLLASSGADVGLCDLRVREISTTGLTYAMLELNCENLAAADPVLDDHAEFAPSLLARGNRQLRYTMKVIASEPSHGEFH